MRAQIATLLLYRYQPNASLLRQSSDKMSIAQFEFQRNMYIQNKVYSLDRIYRIFVIIIRIPIYNLYIYIMWLVITRYTQNILNWYVFNVLIHF